MFLTDLTHPVAILAYNMLLVEDENYTSTKKLDSSLRGDLPKWYN